MDKYSKEGRLDKLDLRGLEDVKFNHDAKYITESFGLREDVHRQWLAELLTRMDITHNKPSKAVEEIWNSDFPLTERIGLIYMAGSLVTRAKIEEERGSMPTQIRDALERIRRIIENGEKGEDK